MSAELLDRGWQALLLLSRAVAQSAEPASFAFLRFGDEVTGEAVTLDRSLLPGADGCVAAVLLDRRLPDPSPEQADAVFRMDGPINVHTVRTGGLTKPVLHLFKTYLPYCFSAQRARALRRTFAVSHFAQTLDGRIASPSGDSRWIGGRANFVHAHRMRALSDAVIIGSRTLRRDRPRLNVRHVEGPQPARVVLSSSCEGLESLARAEGGPVVLVGAGEGAAPPGVRRITLPRGPDGYVPAARILSALYEDGVRSAYIEGGAFTTSRFVEETALDILQVHIAPMILGAGLNSFDLPSERRGPTSIRLSASAFTPVDDGLMIVGALGRDAAGGAGP